jgi:hypothetical protein
VAELQGKMENLTKSIIMVTSKDKGETAGN